MTRLLAIALAFALTATGARAATIQVAGDHLDAAIKAASSGDVLQVTSDVPDMLVLRGTAGVTVDFGAHAYQAVIAINTTSLTLLNGECRIAAGRPCVTVNGGDLVTISGAHIVGDGSNVTGIMLRGVTHVAVTDNRMERTGRGIMVLQVNGGDISGNQITAGVADGIGVAASSHLTITGNSCAGFGDTGLIHKDCAQIDQLNPVYGNVPVTFAEIAYNQWSGPIQGIDAFGAASISDSWIHDNHGCSAAPQGVSFYAGPRIRVENNEVRTCGNAKFQTNIYVKPGVGITSCGNIVHGYKVWPGRVEPPCK